MSGKFRSVRTMLLASLVLAACGFLAFAQAARAGHKPNHNPGGGQPPSGPEYVVIDLGQNGSRGAKAVNNFGGVVTNANSSGVSDLWQLDASGNVTGVLPIPGLASDLNDAFEIVGHVFQPNGMDEAMLWRLDSNNMFQSVTLLTNLPVAPGNHLETFANGVSSSGLVAGLAREEDSFDTLVSSQAVVWQVDPFDQVNSFTLPDGIVAHDVNLHGVVTGRTAAGPAVWKLNFDAAGQIVSVSAPTALPGIGGTVSGVGEITDGGRIGGSARMSDEEEHAVVWTVDSTGLPTGLEDFGLPGGTSSVGVRGVNDLGQIVADTLTIKVRGCCVTFQSDPWFGENGNLVNLNDLVTDYGGLKSLTRTSDINDVGWIVGDGLIRTSGRRTSLRAYVAIPVGSGALSAANIPEPSTCALAALGLVAVAFHYRRRFGRPTVREPARRGGGRPAASLVERLSGPYYPTTAY